MLRLPPQVIDRWITIGTISDATPSGEERIFSIGDAAWNHTVGVNESYLYGFLAGGPLGLSFDLTKVSKKVFEKLKTHIAKFKKERIFWKTANCRIVAEGSELFALQYSDEWKKKNVIQLFVNRNMQESIRIYPVLDPEIEYTLSDGTVATGKKLMDEGIHITIPKLFSVYSIVLENK